MSSFLLGLDVVVESLGHMATLCLTFERVPNCFLKMLYHFTFLSAMYKGSNFSIFLLTLIVGCLSDFSHFGGCKVVSQCDFDLYFPDG